MSALTPRPYQLVGRDFLAGRTRALLADEMRVGKTPQAILAAEKLGADRVLILCPAIAVPHWQREWWKWWSAEKAPRRLEWMSYDKARNLWQSGELKDTYFDVLIVDEAHFCKNPEAARTQMVYGKGGLGYQCGAIWALSGTPAPKHAGELWPMLRAFGVTDYGYGDFTRRYCTGFLDPRGKFVVTGTRTAYVAELRAMLAPIMLRRTRKDVAPEMPEIDFQFLEVEPKRSGDLVVPFGLSDEALLEWLEKNATADPGNRQRVALAKVEPLVEEITFAIENGLLKQTVVFGWHKEPLYALAKSLQARGISAFTLTGDTPSRERETIQQRFREGSIDVICANILAAGTAIDLSAASHAYFSEMSWVSGDNLQAANRLVSMQKNEPVTVDIVTWPGSTDDRVQRVLTRRAKELRGLLG